MTLIKRKKKGFTLVELLVVMSIIFVFMSMIIPRFKGYSTKANSIKVDNIGRQVYTAAMMSYMEAGGKFDEDKLEGSITELLGVIWNGKEGTKTVDVNLTEGEIAEVIINLDNETYNLTINPEGYIFNSKSIEEPQK